jgi:PAS domain S-box-containing protein
MFGLSSDEALGQNVNIIMPEPYASEHNSYLKRYRDTGEARVIGIGREVEGRRKDGSVFPVDLSVTELWFGEQRKFVGITRSLEEKRQIEDDRNQFFRLSVDMICIANFDGYFVQLNPAWERILGFTAEELLAKPFIEYVHPDDQEATQAEAQRLAQGQEMISFENRYRTKDGEYRWFLWTASASEERGLIFALARDITDLRRSAEELKQAKDLAEKATQAKSEFLANMSHELRTPLNSVIGFTNVLLKDKDHKLNEAERTYLERILGNGKHLLDLINDILDLSKVEAGKLELELAPVSLNQVIEGTLSQLEGQVQGTRIQLETQIPENIELLNTDKAKLKQVLINLVGNAIKFTEEGSVTVLVHTVSGTSNPERIEVQDTGIGIPPDRLSTIFEAFQQVDTSTSRKFEGTGLGLAISHSLCELMGYQLTVESEPGVGSTFSIILSNGGKT